MYYPDVRYVSRLTTIHRECMLPESAIGNVRTHEGAKVDVRDVVVNGAIPARHIIIDAAKILGVRDSVTVKNLLLVKLGTAVDEQVAIAGKRKDRGKRVFSPVRGIVAAVDYGRIIMQEMPQVINLEAGVKGRVVQVYPNRGVAVEAVGALAQGVWGNGRSVIATLRLEPAGNLRQILEESLDITYKGAVMVLFNSLPLETLELAEEGNISGLIVPSIRPEMQDRVMSSRVAVMVTEGFGTARMNGEIYALLKEYEGFQVTLDADNPGRWESRRPEAVINRVVDEAPPGLNLSTPLRVGMRVRITRPPYLGQMAKVADLPEQTLLLPNGLRVAGARVELISGETVNIPLANLELAGR